MLLAASATAGIVSNQSSTSEDSICISFQPLDSLGGPVEMVSNDSLYLTVFYPGGELCYKDSMSSSNSRISSVVWEDWDGAPIYSFRESVAEIDGVGLDGVYKYHLVVDDADLELATVWSGEFQLCSSGKLDVTLDRVAAILDSIQSQYDWVADSDICDSVNGAISDDNKGNFHSKGDTIQRNASILTDDDYIGVNLQKILNQDALLYLEHTIIQGVTLVDTASIARSVWDNDILTRSARSIGFADTVNTVLNTTSGGTGAFACSLYCLNMADSSAIQGAFVRVLNSDQNATCGIGQTNTQGLSIFSLDSTQYHAWGYLTGYSFFSLPDTLIVTASGYSDTLWAERYDPGEPTSPALCRAYGWVNDLSGNPMSGVTVQAAIGTAPLSYGSIIVSPYNKSTVTDSVGYWQLDLIPNESLQPEGTKYIFTVYYNTGSIATKVVEVPDLASWQLNW